MCKAYLEGDFADMLKEAIEVAACCVAMFECAERGKAAGDSDAD